MVIYEANKRRSPGSIASWTRRTMIRIETGRTDTTVPCNGCTACCRYPDLEIDVQPDEIDQFPEAVRSDEDDKWMLPRQTDGACVHLVEGKCDVYHRRPQSCRDYDCRGHIVGYPPFSADKTHALDAFGRWGEWKIETPEDVDAMFAWHLSFGEMLRAEPSDAEQMLALILRGVPRFLPFAHKMRESLGFRKAREQAKEHDRRFRSYVLSILSQMQILPEEPGRG